MLSLDFIYPICNSGLPQLVSSLLTYYTGSIWNILYLNAPLSSPEMTFWSIDFSCLAFYLKFRPWIWHFVEHHPCNQTKKRNLEKFIELLNQHDFFAYFFLFCLRNMINIRGNVNWCTQGDLTQIFPTFPKPIINLVFHMKTDPGLSWVSNDR